MKDEGGRKGKQRPTRPDGIQCRPLFFHFILHPSSFILHPSSFILHPSSFILHPSSFILHPSSLPFILHPCPSSQTHSEKPAYEERQQSGPAADRERSEERRVGK